MFGSGGKTTHQTQTAKQAEHTKPHTNTLQHPRVVRPRGHAPPTGSAAAGTCGTRRSRRARARRRPPPPAAPTTPTGPAPAGVPPDKDRAAPRQACGRRTSSWCRAVACVVLYVQCGSSARSGLCINQPTRHTNAKRTNKRTGSPPAAHGSSRRPRSPRRLRPRARRPPRRPGRRRRRSPPSRAGGRA